MEATDVTSLPSRLSYELSPLSLSKAGKQRRIVKRNYGNLCNRASVFSSASERGLTGRACHGGVSSSNSTFHGLGDEHRGGDNNVAQLVINGSSLSSTLKDSGKLDEKAPHCVFVFISFRYL
jgi:hypothetical protein